MAKKKSKKSSRKTSKRTSKKAPKNASKVSKDKLKISQRGFLWSLVLSVAFYILYIVSSSEFFVNLFGLLLIIFGALGFAFLISLIVIWIARKK